MRVNGEAVPWKLAVPRDAEQQPPPKTRKEIETRIRMKIKTKIETRRLAYGCECDSHP